jgi:hypothetical protein
MFAGIAPFVEPLEVANQRLLFCVFAADRQPSRETGEAIIRCSARVSEFQVTFIMPLAPEILFTSGGMGMSASMVRNVTPGVYERVVHRRE